MAGLVGRCEVASYLVPEDEPDDEPLVPLPLVPVLPLDDPPMPLEDPVDPVDPLVPLDPPRPLDPVVPLEPLMPVDPDDPLIPLDPLMPLEPLGVESVLDVPDEVVPFDMPEFAPFALPELRAFSRAMHASFCDAGTLAQIAVASSARLDGTRFADVPVVLELPVVPVAPDVVPVVAEPVPDVCAVAAIAVPSAI